MVLEPKKKESGVEHKWIQMAKLHKKTGVLVTLREGV
jgi:hypothetical protein